jgi:hypothetical protein
MAEPHVVAALRDKRAELSGSVADLEKQIGRHCQLNTDGDSFAHFSVRIEGQKRINRHRK